MEKLVGLYVANGGYFEITLNLPRTIFFTGLLSERQKELYSCLWDNTKNIITPLAQTDRTFEFCKSGHIHLHGYIAVPAEKKIIPVGAVADIVKRFVKVYNKVCGRAKSRDQLKYNEKSLWIADCVYRSPAICVRYRTLDNVERIQHWIEYMYKCGGEAHQNDFRDEEKKANP